MGEDQVIKIAFAADDEKSMAAARQAQKTAKQAADVTTDMAKKTADATMDVASKAIDTTMDVANKAADATKDVAGKALDATLDIAGDTVRKNVEAGIAAAALPPRDCTRSGFRPADRRRPRKGSRLCELTCAA